MIVKMEISYDGTNYYGFQHQDDLPTIEDYLLEAIQKVDSSVEKIYGSGRTDRFVHAKCQVISFESKLDIKEYNWCRAVNSFLPLDIRVNSAKNESDDFHARFSAKSKEYRYYIKNTEYSVFDRNYTEYITNLDVDKMDEAIKLFIGTHDFKGFCSAQINELKDTVKTIYEAKINRLDDKLEIVFIGNGFLKYQVRTMVGTLVDIGLGRKNISIIDEIFEKRDPKLSNKVVSGHGLFLYKVNY